jgi:hypothetical protein
MLHLKSLVAFLAVASAMMVGTAVLASTPSCTWTAQPDGTQFGVCVGNDGVMFCVSCSGNSCPRVSC